MKSLLYSFITYTAVLFTGDVISCQPWDIDEVETTCPTEKYDHHTHMWQDYQEIRAMKEEKHRAHTQAVAEKVEIARISAQEPEDAKDLRKKRHEVAKLHRAVTEFVAQELEKRGMDPRSVNVQIKLSYKGQ